MSMTAPERETVITFSDADDTATVHTHQRRIITKLRNNRAAKQTKDLAVDGKAGAVFELPADLISFRSKKRHTDPGAAIHLRKRPFGRAISSADGTQEAA
jgi:hypothetical protein